MFDPFAIHCYFWYLKWMNFVKLLNITFLHDYTIMCLLFKYYDIIDKCQNKWRLFEIWVILSTLYSSKYIEWYEIRIINKVDVYLRAFLRVRWSGRTCCARGVCRACGPGYERDGLFLRGPTRWVACHTHLCKHHTTHCPQLHTRLTPSLHLTLMLN